jgi:hypothetical protein
MHLWLYLYCLSSWLILLLTHTKMEWRNIPTQAFVSIPFKNLMKGPMLCNDGKITDDDMSILEN